MRKRNSYVSIQDQSDVEKVNQRQRWANAKKRQREKSRDARLNEDVPKAQVKRFKDMNTEEKKAYFKEQMRKSRAKMSKQKKTTEKLKSRKKVVCSKVKTPHTCTTKPCEAGSSRATQYRRKKRVIATMPKSPKSYADVVSSTRLWRFCNTQESRKHEKKRY